MTMLLMPGLSARNGLLGLSTGLRVLAVAAGDLGGVRGGLAVPRLTSVELPPKAGWCSWMYVLPGISMGTELAGTEPGTS